ncbi:MAG TPA: S53 family peptidase [Caulobacteraceae bacterium]|nr:S53 family peptidase [Caulobacteraceae bacterium]
MKFAVSLALAAAFGLGAVTAVQAQQAPTRLELSGSTFHRSVCADVPRGYMRCHAHIVTDSRGNPIFNAMRPNKPGGAGSPSGYNPADLRAAYNITSNGSSSTTVAIVDAYGYANAEADLQVYRSQFGLPTCTTANGCFKKVSQTGSTTSLPRENLGWSEETALDLDMVSAMCPNCKILLVEANDSGSTNLGVAENEAAALGAHVISNSYGGGEQGAATYDHYYTHPGVAITVSTGDSGYGVQYPASSPNVTAVGGTHMVRSTGGRGFTETVWTGAGSGCSGVFAKPTWQHDTLCTKRMEADVSAVADPNTGVSVYGPGGHGSAWAVYGGTSVAAPLVGGIYGNNGGSVSAGGSNPYGATGALNDVVSGSNGSCGGTYFCTAGAGYDGPTGLGTPNGLTAF